MARPFLLRTRWLVGHFVIIGLIVLFLVAMNWQVNRLDERKDRNRATESAMRAEPVANVPAVDAPNWQHVVLSGTWDPNATQLLCYPLHDGQTGYEVLSSLVTADGSTVLVDRGWVPLEIGKAMTKTTAAPTGTVEVDGWYRHAQKGDTKVGTNGTDLPTVTKIMKPYLQILPNKPSGDIVINGQTSTPVTPDGPDLGTGPHYGYAWQWFSFVLIAIFGWAALLWKAYKEEQLGAIAGEES